MLIFPERSAAASPLVCVQTVIAFSSIGSPELLALVLQVVDLCDHDTIVKVSRAE